MASLTAIFKALSNPNRRTVYTVICQGAGKRRKGITIEDICKRTGMKQPAVSHHVAKLAAAGLIDRVKDRWWVHCSPSPAGMEEILRFARNPGLYPPQTTNELLP